MNDAHQEIAARLWFRMLRLHTRMNSAVGRRLKEVGLSVPQCDVLSTLTEREGISQQDLAERLYVTKGNISGLIDRLVQAGLVERRTFEFDRRSHAIFLSAAGRRLAVEAIKIQEAFVAETLGQLSSAQLAAFEELLLATRDIVRANEARRVAGQVVAPTPPTPQARRSAN
jgi:DNA-binding MarR family transcriptional regulator